MAMWDKIGSTGNVEDRRASPMGLAIGGGGSILGIIAILAFSFLTGQDLPLDQIVNQAVTQQPSERSSEFEGADDYETFASRVLGSTNDTWREAFGGNYREPTLVLFREATRSGCGIATSSVGPHYCPADETIYLDETFFDELTNRLGAKGGDVAEAYVIAHEVGHHVQNISGIMQQAQANYQDTGEGSNAVKLELQADCFAGVWAYSVAQLNIFEPGEINEAIDAAAAVGDDHIQQETTGQINPETWTHGSSQQRKAWFERGYKTGEPRECNTFTEI